MPLKSIIAIMVAVAVASLAKPEWSFAIIWLGGMALLWVITGDWTPPSRKPQGQAGQEDAASEPKPGWDAAEDLRPAAGTMEAEDLDDLARLDGAPLPEDEPQPAAPAPEERRNND